MAISRSDRSRAEVTGRAAGRRKVRAPGPARGPPGEGLEEPLQAELLSVRQLEAHARSMAAGHAKARVSRRREDALLARLSENEISLRGAYAELGDPTQRRPLITPAAEWFLDNFHLIEEQIRAARRHLPPGYQSELPRVEAQPVASVPRVYDVALALIRHTHGRVDLEALRAFLSAYQAVQPLRLGELWAVPIMLRLALLENLRRVVVGVVAGREDRERGARWVAEMVAVAEQEAGSAVIVLADLVEADEPLTDAFVAEFAVRLQAQGPALSFATSWLDQRLASGGRSIEHVLQLATQSQAADQVSVGNSIGTMRFLGATDWRAFVEEASVVERVLRTDPSGHYPAMDFSTRDAYRHAVERLARRVPLAEEAVARAAVGLAVQAGPEGPHGSRAHHVGYFLVDGGLGELFAACGAPLSWGQRALAWVAREPLPHYALALVAATGLGVWALARVIPVHPHGWLFVAWVGLLVLSASQLAVALVHAALTMTVRPLALPRLELLGGVGAIRRTVVAVPTLLVDAADVDAQIEALEVRALGNRDPHVAFALLTDFPDAASEELPGDAALLAHAEAAMRSLTRRSDPHASAGFLLLHRPRRWSEAQGVWMGRERKRGKLGDLDAALRGDSSAFSKIVGDVASLAGTAYVIVLDADTLLPRDAARRLVGTMAHPLHRPVIDPALGRVVSGYGILQPRVMASLESTNASRFARLFAGDSRIDPYSRAVSDVYQDVFGEGSFVGKGIYDVDAVRAVLAGRLPPDRVLSHDLLEGAHARAGLVTDVLLVEDFPATHAADASRRARWIRGDWQIAAWLLPRAPVPGGGVGPNPTSMLSRWKILDNLRRSAIAPALLVLLAWGWATPSAGLATTLAVLAILGAPGLLVAFVSGLRRPDAAGRGVLLGEVGAGLGHQLAREAYALACLPHEAAISVGSAVRALVRVGITHRHTLEWRTARDAQRSGRLDLVGTYVAMWPAPVAALVLSTLTARLAPGSLGACAPLLVAWFAAPLLALWSSRPLTRRAQILPDEDARFLRGVARRTWRFFDTFVGAEDNFLPPDNVQLDPPRGAAHRTSPTNVGLSMLADLGAHDLGYLTVGGLIARTSAALASLERMERHRGHFYNWYDTVSLQPLRPIYVSTVDSGNLSGHLDTLAAGLEELCLAPLLPPRLFEGLRTALELVVDEAPSSRAGLAAARWLERDGATPATHAAMHAWLQGRFLAVERLRAALLDDGDEAPWPLVALDRDLGLALEELRALAPWVELDGPLPDRLDRPLGLSALAGIDDSAAADLVDPAVRDAAQRGARRATERVAALRDLARRCRSVAAVDVDFLYDPQRRLLSIGYSVAEHRLDASFYDLLASEARLASYVAIARGKLPQEHWFSLGRALTTTAGRPALLSWSGSMFEYLMPMLVMPSHAGTLLARTCEAAVDRQIAYGDERRVPWGISESGYSQTDAQANYQYRAFGVPGLGFKRGLGDELVVAPYATALALMVAPEAACANLRRLEREGRMGPHGFYEAIDYSPSRLSPGVGSVTVESYMAHHQGMTLLSLVYVLCDRPMQRRFASDPAFRAVDLLLQERVPRFAQVVQPHPAEHAPLSVAPPDPDRGARSFETADTPTPEVHLLSNGSYHVAITNAGGGFSRWRDLSVTRWQEDATRDAWGTFVYLRDVGTGAFWSGAHQPTCVRAERYEAIQSPGRMEFRRTDGDFETYLEIATSPEDDVELRRVTVTNESQVDRTLELTSYAEVVLASAASDAAHRAFSGLFVQTEILRESQAILCTRRPRSQGEHPPFLIHLVALHGGGSEEPTYDTSRAAFLGRGRDASDPIAMHRPHLGDSEGSVLDPVVAMRRSVCIAAGASASFHVVTGVGATRAEALALVEKYGDAHAADRVFELAWTHSRVLQRRLQASNQDVRLFERLAGQVLYGGSSARLSRGPAARAGVGQSRLWAHGISGDLPIVLVRVGDVAHLPLVRKLVEAHAYWRIKGLVADLVVWNEDASGYRQVLQDEILAVVAGTAEAGPLDRPGGIFVRKSDQIAVDDGALMQSVARVVMNGAGGSLTEQVERQPLAEALPAPHPAARADVGAPAARAPRAPMALERPDLVMWNGSGGFTPDGREYVITTTADAPTPAPWVNVIANPSFGTVVSESGSAYTFCENAHGYRLTPWHNDAVSDPSGEALYLRDEDDGRVFCPTPAPIRTSHPVTSRHGFGYSVFERDERGVRTELKTFVAVDAPVKFLLLTVENRTGRRLRLSVLAYFELVLGTHRGSELLHVSTELDVTTGALLGKNRYHGAFAERVAFLDASERVRAVTGDRTEVLGRNGSMAHPACLGRVGLSGRVGASLDPCLAMQTMIEVDDGAQREIAFTFGSGRDAADARELVRRFRGVGAAHAALEAVWRGWGHTTGAIRVETPDRSVDFAVNGWLVYQVLSCRMWARSGFYQSGGAFGFRDQLQDAMALVHAAPAELRAQILRAAARQFPEGDVQHWWHPPEGRGVRTRISDDFLWLPYAVARYVETIGDTGVLDEVVPYLAGRAVRAGEDSYYDLPARDEAAATVYEHCVRAIENGLRRGEHGLPLMGSGDWNDGMNLVGDQGRGESVWLAFFQHDVLARFRAVAVSRGDAAFARTCDRTAAALAEAIAVHGWDGAWYRRAYLDDGAPLGSAENLECAVDSLPQSWATLAGVGSAERARQALDAVATRLVSSELGVIRLFDPPFDTSAVEPGYVKGYVPGVRENGGQYTHAAVWAVMAFAKAGLVEEAWELYRLIDPARHGASAAALAVYQVEPYVVAADVYTNPEHAGRGGWTWYTGSAGWMLRLLVESLLGLRLEVDRLRIAPLLPAAWSGFTAHYRHRRTTYRVRVERVGEGYGVGLVECDGVVHHDGTVPLRDDGLEHRVRVHVGGPR